MRQMSVLWLMNANTRNTPVERPKQNGPGIAPGAVSMTQRVNTLRRSRPSRSLRTLQSG